MDTSKQCSKRVFSGARWDHGGHQCAKRGKVQVDGKWYCTIHTPEYEAQHDAKLRAKWQAESALMDARYAAERQRNADALLGALVRQLPTKMSLFRRDGTWRVEGWTGTDIFEGEWVVASGATPEAALVAAGIVVNAD